MSDYRKKPHWTKASDGAWAVCIPGKKVGTGTQIIVEKSDGDIQFVTVTRYREKGINGHLYSVDTSANDRLDRAADLTNFNIDVDNQSGTFFGRGGEVYTTTHTSCTCQDFIKRGEPCKHMYRLIHELRGTVSITSKIEDLYTSIKPTSPPILYKIVAFIFWTASVLGLVLFIYAILHGTIGEVIFGTILTFVSAFIGAAAFSVSKEAKANMDTVDEISSDDE